MRRVVVTGIGMCSPLGYGVNQSWKKLINAESGIRELTGFDLTDLSSKVGGQIPLDGVKDLFPENVIEVKEKKKWSLLFSSPSLQLKRRSLIQVGYQKVNWIPRIQEL